MRHLVKSTLSERQIQRIRKLQFLSKLALEELRLNLLGSFFPLKPRSLNLLVNDVCNSRCQMCLIWKQKKDKELSPDELRQILADDLFSQLQYIGVSGGEPTLRRDLPELFEVICSKSPPILNTGIITNGLLEEVVKEQVLACAEICKSRGVGFNVMVSLDGLREIHDAVRGRNNNFNSAISLLHFFHKETDIPTSFGCTVVETNAPYVDELLDHVKAEGLYGRFRVAEFIDRLYNQEQKEFIRSFDEKLAYHLGLFFFRVEHDFETNLTFQKTYKNIRGMLVEGKPRQIGCPYQTQAVVLTSRGDLLYCSPKSPILGSALQVSAKSLYFTNLFQRQEIIKKDCSNCIHDYHDPVTFREVITARLEARRKHNKYQCTGLIEQAIRIAPKKQKIVELNQLSAQNVLIVGWYGTETAGDKAILWTILKNLRSRPHPPQKIYLSSLYPFVSLRTVKEMELGDISIVETYSNDFENICNTVDEVVVGGGPLMDIEPLSHILYAFIQAAKSQAISRIEGCGIGPLSSPLYTRVVEEIFKLADYISLRDRASTHRCLHEFEIRNVKTQCDPAVDYVESVKNKSELLKDSILPLGNTRNISCFLREWGRDYAGELEESEYKTVKNRFEAQLAQLIIWVACGKEADVHLLPMHSFLIGGDDRVFNRYLTQQVSPLLAQKASNLAVRFAREPLSPLEILQSMYRAKFNICMRFHSVLFAETLGVPYLAIDYTRGGKIQAFLEDRGQLGKLISLQEIVEGEWQTRVSDLLGENN
jgi:MoaA/NifB/PqqE/SkfB family radical SAM enzyme/polysaccharide pyruvyl transferase WcaK-like protein